MKQKLHYPLLRYAIMLMVCFLGLNSWGQVSITAVPYTKSDNFDAYNPISATDANSTIPTGWTLSTTGNSYVGRATGTGATGGIYAYGSGSDYSLGALPSGSNTHTYTVSFVNNTGAPITSLKISWDYEQWRYGGNASGWDVTGTGALATNTTLNGKDFSGVPSGNSGTVAVTAVPEFTLTGLNIANGAAFGIKWATTNLAGTDNGVSIDNFHMTATGDPVVIPVVNPASFNGTVGTAFSQNISATGNPTSYAIVTGTLPAGLTLNTTTGAITGTPTAAGSATVTVKGTNSAGDSTPAAIDFTIAKANQTITFANINKQYGDAAFPLTGTSSAGLTLAYSSSNTAVATISGNTVTITGVGTANITASQPGDANYNAATDVVRTLTVTKKNVTITGLTANNKVADGTNVATLSGTPTLSGVMAADNGNVTLSGTAVATFASSSVGNGIAVTVTGYAITGSAAANYNLVQPTGLTANITALPAPVATAATAIGAHDFTAHWNAVSEATAYRLDVSEYATFGTSSTASVLESFENGLSTSGYVSGNASLSSGSWPIVAVLRASGANTVSGYGAQLRASDGEMTTPSFAKISSVVFSAKRGSSASTMVVSKIVGGVTTQLQTISLTNTFEEYTIPVNETSNDVKILIENGSGVAYVDELTINYMNTVPSFVTGYNNRNVGNVTSFVVNGLNPNTTYHYRVRAENSAATSVNSNVIDVTTGVTEVTWDGTAWSNVTGPDANIEATIAGAYNTNTNGVFTAKKLTLNSGSFRIVSGTNLTVVNDVVNNMTAADFVIENNANLIQTNAVANTGAVTLHRNSAPIVRLDHTLWSSPVEDQNLFGFSPNTLTNRFYTYQTATNTFVNTGLSATSTFVPGKGFAVRAPNNYQASPAAAWEGIFVGKPNNGSISFALETTGTGYNLVGNPYPSVVNGTNFVNNNPTIDGTLYFYAHTLTMNAQGQFPAGTNYATWTPGSGGVAATLGTSGVPANVPNGKIQVGQGFLVKSLPAGGNVHFENTMREANNADQFFRGVATMNTATPTDNEIERHRIWLNLTNDAGTAFNQILVAYAEGATEGVDRGYDGLAFGNTGSSLSSKIAGADYTIQGRALPFNDSDVVALGFKAATAGNYTISLASFDGLFTGNQEIYLKDKSNGTVHNLRTGDYTFASAEGTFDDRFEMVYKNTLGTIDATLDANTVVVYKQNAGLHIETKNTSIKEVTVYDINGRLVYQKGKVNNNVLIISDLLVAQQVLLVQVTADNNKTTTVKVVY